MINQRIIKAKIGYNFPPLLAGKTPKIKPIEPERLTVKVMTLISILAGRAVVRATALTEPTPMNVPIMPIIRETSPITFRHRATELAPDIVTCFALPREYVQLLPKLRHEVAEIPNKMDTGKTIRREGRSKNLNPFVKSNVKVSKFKLTAAVTIARKNITLIHII